MARPLRLIQYYVSAANGNDANDGLTPDTPFRTIARFCKAEEGLPRIERGEKWDEMLILLMPSSPHQQGGEEG